MTNAIASWSRKNYVELRSTLSKKTLYKRKQMGLWMDYNYLTNNNMDDRDPRANMYY